MVYFHPNLTQEKWNALGRTKQILNIAAELARARNLLKSNLWDNVEHSLDRALELVDITINDNNWRGGRLHELLRLREILGEYYQAPKDKSAAELRQLTKILCSFDKEAQQVEI